MIITLFGVNTNRVLLSSVHRSPSTQVTRCAMSWGETLPWDRSPAFRGWPQASSLKQSTVDKPGFLGPSEIPICRNLGREGRAVPGVTNSKRRGAPTPSAWLPHRWVCRYHPHRFSRCFSQQDQTAVSSGSAWQEKASLAPVQVGKARGRSLIAQLWVPRLLFTFTANKSESYQCYNLLYGGSNASVLV